MINTSVSKHQPFEPEMVRIPAGPFLMGTSGHQIDRLAQTFDLAKKWREKGYFGRERPQHTVTLPGYAIAKYPVTVGVESVVGQGSKLPQGEV